MRGPGVVFSVVIFSKGPCPYYLANTMMFHVVCLNLFHLCLVVLPHFLPSIIRVRLRMYVLFFFCKHPSIYVHSLFFPAHILNYVRFFFSVSFFLFPPLVLESRSVSIFLSSVFFHLTFIRSLFIYLHFPPFCNPWLLMISHVSCAIVKAVFFYHQVSWVPYTVSFSTFR